MTDIKDRSEWLKLFDLTEDSTMSILEIGAGKKEPTELSNNKDFRMYVDRCYQGDGGITNEDLGDHMSLCPKILFVSMDIFKFLDSYPLRFNMVKAYRIFEHMEYCSGEIGRLLEALNMITDDQGAVDIIVPNAHLLSEKLISLEKEDYHNSEDILLLNSEFTNIKADPHASIWTPKLARKYIEPEDMWDIIHMEPKIMYMGRDIYMRIILKKKDKRNYIK